MAYLCFLAELLISFFFLFSLLGGFTSNNWQLSQVLRVLRSFRDLRMAYSCQRLLSRAEIMPHTHMGKPLISLAVHEILAELSPLALHEIFQVTRSLCLQFVWVVQASVHFRNRLFDCCIREVSLSPTFLDALLFIRALGKLCEDLPFTLEKRSFVIDSFPSFW